MLQNNYQIFEKVLMHMHGSKFVMNFNVRNCVSRTLQLFTATKSEPCTLVESILVCMRMQLATCTTL